MSVESKTAGLGDVALSHYLFDESHAEVTDPRINELAQECLSRLEETTNMPLIVTDQAGPVERLRSVFRSVMSQNTPLPTAAQRENLAEYYAALKTQKNEELRKRRIIFWSDLAKEPLNIPDLDKLSGNEVEVAFRKWLDEHPECLNKTSLTIKSPIQCLPPEIGLFTQLKHLVLEGTYVTELPPEIGNLTQLESLEIKHHQLRRFPPEISNLKKLKTLEVYFAKTADSLIIPSEIVNLPELKYLNLRYNLIENVAVLGSMSQLEQLDLSHTKMEEFPLELCQLSQLTFLDLNTNPLTKLPLRFDRLTQLEYLDIRSTEIGEMDPVLTLKLSQIKEFRRAYSWARQFDSSIDHRAEAEIGQVMAMMHLMSTMQASSPLNAAIIEPVQNETTTFTAASKCVIL